jgi:O-acetyl-ADP-ribose deacetylase (regulator of RNase III)
MIETKIGNTVVRLEKGDLSAIEIEAIVHYANPDLVLGSGFGSAIATRGGASIQEELKSFGSIDTGESVVSSAGDLKSNFIVHAVGPRFQEDGIDEKLEKTMHSALLIASEKGIVKIAFPPMGTGFFGIPLDSCAQIMLEAIKNHIVNGTSLKEIVICVLDNREYRVFQEKWENNRY